MRCKNILALVLILFCVPAFAQKETGGIVGKITDTEGGGLPGVTVSILSLEYGNKVVQTDNEGNYRVPNLAPGFYEVKVEMPSFQTAIRKEVRVFVGTNTTVNVSIGQAVEATIEITGETPVIDVTTAASSKTVPLEQVENLPKFSFALDLFTLTPGIGDLSYVAYGAGGSQANAYWFDGVDISNPVSGSYWVYPNYNWIEELQVIGIGAPAEYGGFTGVITNSVSRTGSNQFHGLFETFYQGEAWTSNNVDEDSEASPDRTDMFTDTTLQLGGPIVQDKLWFFVGGQLYYQRYAPFGYPPSGPEAFVKDTQPRILSKLTYKANQDNTLQGFIEWDNYDREGQAADSFTLPEATGVVEAPEWFWNASWVSLVNPETVLDVRFSGYQARYDILPQNGDIAQHFNSTTGELTDNYWRFYITYRSRNQVNGSVSHHASDFIAGEHDFKFGIEAERSNADRDERYTGGAYYIDNVYYSPGVYYDYRYLWEGYDSFGRIRRVSTFAQDSWRMNDKLTVNLGVRYDHNHVYLNEAPEIEFTTTPIAPRLGFVYDITGNQTTIIKAHYGHYYEGPITFYIDGIDDFGDRTTSYRASGTTGEWIDFEFTPGDSFWEIDPDLKQPFTRQFTVGVDQQFKGGWNLSAHYIYRKDEDLIEDIDQVGEYVPISFVNPLTGETMTLFSQTNPDAVPTLLITNVDELYRNYHGVEIYGGKRFSNKFAMNGSVVFSRTRGNVSNSDGGANGFQTIFDDPNFNINIDGRPFHDPTVEVKITGIYELPWDIRSSFYYRHFSGDTWTTTFRTPRNTLGQGAITIFAEPRGTNRLDSRNVVDFRLEKDFPIGAGDLKITADFFNLFNSGYVLDLENRFDVGTFLEPADISSPREVRLGVRYQF